MARNEQSIPAIVVNTQRNNGQPSLGHQTCSRTPSSLSRRLTFHHRSPPLNTRPLLLATAILPSAIIFSFIFLLYFLPIALSLSLLSLYTCLLHYNAQCVWGRYCSLLDTQTPPHVRVWIEKKSTLGVLWLMAQNLYSPPPFSFAPSRLYFFRSLTYTAQHRLSSFTIRHFFSFL